MDDRGCVDCGGQGVPIVDHGLCEVCWDAIWFHADDDGWEDDCTRCGGEGWRECHDPIQCTSPHNAIGEHRCKACGGSGNAKDQTIW